MDDLTREFLVESQEGLDRMERCLTELEARPGDGSLVAEIFRAVHTIKGTTGFLGFRRLEKLAHAGENLLGRMRDGRVRPTPEVIDALLALLDGLRAILKWIEIGDQGAGEEAAGDDSALIARLAALEAGAAGGPDERRGSRQREKPGRKRARRAGHAAIAAEEDDARRAASQAAAASPVSACPGSASPGSASPGSASPEPVHSAQPRASVEPGSAPPVSESTLRVDVELLNRMMNLVGELVLTRNRILQTVASGAGQATGAGAAMTRLVQRLDAVTAELREAAMKARMQPVSHVFSKMPRLVRDLARTLGRRVRLELQGQETELDKGLLEAIGDPLTHAVRNALDHGIEPPEARAAAGKNPEGTLTLSAAHAGSHVIVEVSDDGAGIPAEKIRARAVELGLVDAERAGSLGERELLQMVFLPGFSTAAAVTSVSGRGVGMDVVRANVEQIGGAVELESQPGAGTTLRMRIPLTLAIVPALIVESCGQSYALPQATIRELVQVSAGGRRSDTAGGAEPAGPVDVEWIGNAPFYRLRGHLLPLVFLDQVLEPACARRPDPQRRIFVAVLETGGRRYGLAVDGLADPEEIVIKPLSPAVKQIGLFSAATVLGNGKLALILDAGAIAARAGVEPIEDRQDPGSAADAAAQAGLQIEYLLAAAAGRRVAIPLACVERIERVRVGQIESAGRHPALFERGHLLPIDDSLDALAAAGGDPDAALAIVVCRQGPRRLGIAVSRALAVARGRPLIDDAAGCQAAGVTLIEGRATEIFDFESCRAGRADRFAHWTAA